MTDCGLVIIQAGQLGKTGKLILKKKKHFALGRAGCTPILQFSLSVPVCIFSSNSSLAIQLGPNQNIILELSVLKMYCTALAEEQKPTIVQKLSKICVSR